MKIANSYCVAGLSTAFFAFWRYMFNVSVWERRAAAVPGLRWVLSKAYAWTYSEPEEIEPAE